MQKAALLGVEFSVPVLLSAGARPDALDRLFDDGWLAQAGPSRARFLQPARLEKIIATIPWSRKRKWHSELARTSGALRQPPGDVARHHLAAREFEAARPLLIRAAEKACLQRRFRRALGFIRQALDIWSADFEPDARLRVLQEMARCAMNCREHAIARLAWEEILEIAPDTGQLVEAHRQLAELDLRAGCFNEAGRHLELASGLAEKALAASEAAATPIISRIDSSRAKLVKRSLPHAASLRRARTLPYFLRRSVTRVRSPPCAARLPKVRIWSNARCGSPLD